MFNFGRNSQVFTTSGNFLVPLDTSLIYWTSVSKGGDGAAAGGVGLVPVPMGRVAGPWTWLDMDAPNVGGESTDSVGWDTTNTTYIRTGHFVAGVIHTMGQWRNRRYTSAGAFVDDSLFTIPNTSGMTIYGNQYPRKCREDPDSFYLRLFDGVANQTALFYRNGAQLSYNIYNYFSTPPDTFVDLGNNDYTFLDHTNGHIAYYVLSQSGVDHPDGESRLTIRRIFDGIPTSSDPRHVLLPGPGSQDGSVIWRNMQNNTVWILRNAPSLAGAVYKYDENLNLIHIYPAGSVTRNKNEGYFCSDADGNEYCMHYAEAGATRVINVVRVQETVPWPIVTQIPIFAGLIVDSIEVRGAWDLGDGVGFIQDGLIATCAQELGSTVDGGGGGGGSGVTCVNMPINVTPGSTILVTIAGNSVFPPIALVGGSDAIGASSGAGAGAAAGAVFFGGSSGGDAGEDGTSTITQFPAGIGSEGGGGGASSRGPGGNGGGLGIDGSSPSLYGGGGGGGGTGILVDLPMARITGPFATNINIHHYGSGGDSAGSISWDTDNTTLVKIGHYWGSSSSTPTYGTSTYTYGPGYGTWYEDRWTTAGVFVDTTTYSSLAQPPAIIPFTVYNGTATRCTNDAEVLMLLLSNGDNDYAQVFYRRGVRVSSMHYNFWGGVPDIYLGIGVGISEPMVMLRHSNGQRAYYILHKTRGGDPLYDHPDRGSECTIRRFFELSPSPTDLRVVLTRDNDGAGHKLWINTQNNTLWVGRGIYGWYQFDENLNLLKHYLWPTVTVVGPPPINYAAVPPEAPAASIRSKGATPQMDGSNVYSSGSVSSARGFFCLDSEGNEYCVHYGGYTPSGASPEGQRLFIAKVQDVTPWPIVASFLYDGHKDIWELDDGIAFTADGLFAVCTKDVEEGEDAVGGLGAPGYGLVSW